MFRYRVDVLSALKSAGYNTYVIRQNKLLTESTLTKLRNNQMIAITSLDKLCTLLDCEIEDLIEHIKE